MPHVATGSEWFGVILIYGLSFTLLGAAALLRPSDADSSPESRWLWLVGWFGILHGVGEFLLLWGTTGAVVGKHAGWLASGTLAISFLPLFEYARRSAASAGRSRGAWWISLTSAWIYLPVLGLMALAISTSPDSSATLLASARYLLGGVGSLGTGIALRRLFAPVAKAPLERIAVELLRASFLSYAFLGGLVIDPVPGWPFWLLNQARFLDATGVPVQLLRAACALTAMLALAWLVRRQAVMTLHGEREQAALLQEMSTSLERRVQQRTADLASINARLLQADVELREREWLLSKSQEAANIGTWHRDLNTGAMRWSRESYRIFGVDPATFQPSFAGYRAMIHPDDVDAVLASREQAITEGGQFEQRHRIVQPNGEVRWVVTIGRRISNSAGAPTGLIGIIQDITHRVRAEEETRAAHQLLEQVIDSLPLYVFVKDLDSHYVLVNKAMTEFYGLTKEQFRDTTPARLPVIGANRDLARTDDLHVFATGQTLIQPEVCLTAPDGRITYRHSTKIPLFDGAGKVKGLLGVGIDITEQLRQQTALRQSEEQFRNLAEGSVQGMLILQGEIPVFSNSAYARIFGFTDAEHVKREFSLKRMYPDDEVARIEGYHYARLRGEYAPEEYEVRGQRLDGTPIWLHNVARQVQWHGQPAVQVTYQDITARKLAEAALQESEERLRQVIQLSNIGIFDHDHRSNRIHWSPELRGILGFSPDENVTLGDFVGRVHAEDRDAVLRAVQQTHDPLGDGSYNVTYRIVRPAGQVSVLEATGQTFFDGAGTSRHPVRTVGAATDITERRQAEEELQRSQALLSSLFDAIPLSILVKDLTGRYTLANRAMIEFWGVSAADVLGHRPSEIPSIASRNPDWIDRMTASDQEVVNSGALVQLPETRVQTVRGDCRWLSNIKAPIRDAAGRVIGIVSVGMDTTERKQAENALRTSEERYRNLVDGSIQGLMVLQNYKAVFTNTAYARIFGFADVEAVKREFTLDAVFSPEVVQLLRESHDRRLKGEAMPEEYEVPARKVDGTPVWIRALARVANWMGEPAVQITVQDITQWKTAEAARRQSQRLLETVIESIPYSIFVKDLDGQYTVVNRALTEFWGATAGEMLGNHLLDLPSIVAMNSEWIGKMMESDRAVIESGQTIELPDSPVRNGRGELRWLANVKAPLRDDSGRVIGLVGIGVDRTERRQAEDALRVQEQLLKTVFETVPIPLFVKNAEGRYEMVNSATAEFYGMSVEQMTGLHTLDLPGQSIAEKTRLLEEDRTVIADRTPITHPELEVVRPNGERVFRYISKRPLIEPDGTVSRLVGVSHDITEIKRAERVARETALIFGQINDSIIAVNLEGQITLWSQGAERMYGYTAAEMLGERLARLWPDDMPGEEKQNELYGELWQTGIKTTVVERQRKSGERIHVSIALAVLRDEHGKPYGIVGTSHDVTALIKAGDALRESERKATQAYETLQLAVQSTPAGLALFDANDRLMVCNSNFLGYFPDGGKWVELGMEFADIVRGFRASGGLVTAGEDGEDWLAGRIARHRDPGEPTMLHLADGRWLQATEHKAKDGGIASVYVDITELVRTRDALQNLNAELEHRVDERTAELADASELTNRILDGSILGISASKASGQCVFVNAALVEMTGGNRRDLLGQNFRENPVWKASGALAMAEEALSTGIPQRREIHLTTSWGKEAWWDCIMTRFNRGGEPHLLFVVGDIMERKLGEQQIARMREQLVVQQKMATIGQLTATVSHELRNPLGTIQTSTYILSERLREQHPDLIPVLGRIERNVVRCDNIINDLLDFSRTRESRPELTGLDDWLRQVIAEQVQPDWLDLRMDLNTQGLDVSFDQERIRRAVINVFENAVQALGEARESDPERPSQVTVHSRMGCDRVEIVMEDTGPGMTEEVLARIFEPLFSTKVYGVGLGLPTVKQIMEQERGGIEFHSEPNRGTEALLWLPLSKPS